MFVNPVKPDGSLIALVRRSQVISVLHLVSSNTVTTQFHLGLADTHYLMPVSVSHCLESQNLLCYAVPSSS
jgi:hypothetical protein